MQAVVKENLENRIHQLDTRVVDQIAAGEVVERPSSVVKELVENSIDAGAKSITVVLENAGKSTIEVIDDGIGMSKIDAALCVERFATSKIKEIEDVFSIKTLGFRGEALSSIASVSNFKLITSNGIDSTQVSVTDSGKKEVEEISAARGTKISVKNLFYNVPARKKFLKSDKSEVSAIRQYLCDAALSNFDIQFKLLADSVELDFFPKANNFIERAKEIKIAGAAPIEIKVNELQSTFKVSGLIAQPVSAQSNANKLRFIINGRSVRDKILLRAVSNAYGNFLKAGRYPSGVIKLELSPEDVDVNVHPQKSEVRFRQPEFVISRLTSAIKAAISGFEIPTAINRSVQSSASLSQVQAEPVKFNFSGVFNEEQIRDSSFKKENKLNLESQIAEESIFVQEESKSYQLDSKNYLSTKRNNKEAYKDLKEMRFVGQIFKCFLLLESQSNEVFAMLDMHAAHERVVFYQMKKNFLEGGISSQGMLIPETVEVEHEFIEHLNENEAILKKFGFDLRVFSDNCIAVDAVPAILSGVNPSVLIKELEDLEFKEGWEEKIESKLDSVISRLACHASIRTGRELNKAEVFELIDLLSEAETSSFCPHGRPIVKYFSRYELDSMFGRANF